MKRKTASLLRMLILCLFLIGVFSVSREVQAASPAAKIGNRSYATLQDAVKAVKNGQTINVVKNLKLSWEWNGVSASIKCVTFSKNKKFTINLKKHTIQSAKKLLPGFDYLLDVKKGKVTIKNGTIKGAILVGTKGNLALTNVKLVTVDKAGNEIEGKLTMKKVRGKTEFYTYKKSKITMQNCTLTAMKKHNLINGWGNLTFKGGTYKGSEYPLICRSSGKVTIENGKFYNKSQPLIYISKYKSSDPGSSVTIKKGTFEGVRTNIISTGGDTKLNITGGTFTTSQYGTILTVGGNDVVSIKGGTFKAYASDYEGSGTIECSGGKLSITGGSFYNNKRPIIVLWASAPANCLSISSGATMKTDGTDVDIIRDERL